MSDMPFSALDVIIIAVMLLSGLFALLRGFVREVFSVVTWVGAVFIAFYLLPYLGVWMREFLTPVGILADLIAFAIPFSIVFFTLFFASGKLVKKLSGTEPGPIDGTAGFFFGLVRGFIIVTVAYFAYDVFANTEDETPGWMAKARFRSIIEETTEAYYDMVPGLKEDEKTASRAENKKKRDADKESGYSNKERDAIDQLFQSSSDD